MIVCSKCNQECKPLNFFVKYCDNCLQFICSDCWIPSNNSQNCPNCGKILSSLSERDTEVLLMQSLKLRKCFIIKDATKFKNLRVIFVLKW
jgi:hypothetical protein